MEHTHYTLHEQKKKTPTMLCKQCHMQYQLVMFIHDDKYFGHWKRKPYSEFHNIVMCVYIYIP